LIIFCTFEQFLFRIHSFPVILLKLTLKVLIWVNWLVISPHLVQLLSRFRRYPIVIKNLCPVSLQLDFAYSEIVGHQNVSMGIHEANAVNFVRETDLSKNLLTSVPDPNYTMLQVTGWCNDQTSLIVEVDSRKWGLILSLLVLLKIIKLIIFKQADFWAPILHNY